MIVQFPIHGGQAGSLAEHYKVDHATLLDFSANINPEGPPASVLKALQANLRDATSLIHYPDLQHVSLRRAIAASVSVDPSSISIANGFVPLLEAALRALPIRSCLLPMPAFNEYQPALQRARIHFSPYCLRAQSGFQYDIGEMMSMPHQAVLFANPQNPSGALTRVEQMIELLEAATNKGMYILLDEAFIDYAPEHSMVPMLERFPRMILFRSVTKFYAIPGMRIAYCVAHADVIKMLNENLPPWPVDNLASIAVQAAVQDEEYADRTRRLNHDRRRRLLQGLETLELQPYPGAANFLLFRLPKHIKPAAFWESMIVDHKIVLRSCENYSHMPTGHLRAAVRDDGDNDRLLQALSGQLSDS